MTAAELLAADSARAEIARVQRTETLDEQLSVAATHERLRHWSLGTLIELVSWIIRGCP